MFEFSKLEIISEYLKEKDKEEKLEKRLYNLRSKIIRGEVTPWEIDEEKKYAMKIYECKLKKKSLKSEFKKIMVIKAGLLVLGITTISILLALSIRCNKKDNSILTSDPISVSNGNELEILKYKKEKSLTKILH